MKTFKIFYKFLFKYKGDFILSLFLVLISVLLSNAFPFLFRYFVNNISSLNARVLFWFIFLSLAARMGGVWVSNYYIYLGDKVLINAAKDARILIFSHIQKLDFAFHVNKKSGELISKTKRGDSAFFDIFDTLNREFLFNVFSFLFMAAAFYSVNKKIVLILFIALLLTVFISFRLIRHNINLRKIHNKEDDNVSHLIVDNLINYETVKYFAKEKREIKNLTEAMNRWTKALYNYFFTFRIINLITSSISNAALILIFYIMGKDVLNGKLTPGDFVFAVSLSLQLLPRIETLVMRARNIAKHYSDLKDYFDILDYPLVMPDSENSEEIKNPSGAINFKNVSFTYASGQEALDNVSIKIIPESTAALVGRSGSGKTTLIKLLLRIYDPASGDIEIDGHNLKNLKKEDLRRLIGVVPQEPILFNNTIGYNIGYPLDDLVKYGGDPSEISGIENGIGTEEKIIAAAKLANLHDFIDKLPNGYNTIVGERGVKLSGGQKQRLAIARVFLLNPPIIIFDEATSHLDSESERLIQDSIERLREHKTLIIIAHRLSTIMKADKIFVLDNGKIKETGIHSELIKKRRGIYKLLWGLQTEGAIA